MVRRTAIRAALVTASLLASAACSGGGADRGSAGANPTVASDPPHSNPTLATLPPATTTTNPYAVPAVIDIAYVNRVLAGLDAVLGDATRLIIRTKTIPREAYDRIAALYADPDFRQHTLDDFQRDIRSGFNGYRSEPGNKITLATQLITIHPRCIFAKVKRDYTNVAITPITSDQLWVALKPLDPQQDANRYNPTSWAYTYDGYPPDRTQPPDPCAA